MTEIKPQYLDELSYAAKYDRQPFRDILTEGIVGIDDLEITELDTPGMGVTVASGAGYVQGDQAATQGHYRIYNDASKNLTIAASNPTNPRKDRIIAQVYDSIDIGGVDDEWVLEVLTGTPAASPVVPDLPDDALDLAIVDIVAEATTIVNANITDQRTQIALQNVSGGGNVKASAYLSADQLNLVDTQATKVLLDTELYDIGSDFDAVTNHRFTAPVNGYYLIQASIGYKAVIADKMYDILIYKGGTGGTLKMFNRIHSTSIDSLSINTTKTLYLTAGEYIELFARVAVGANTVDVDGHEYHTFLTVHLISV